MIEKYEKNHKNILRLCISSFVVIGYNTVHFSLEDDMLIALIFACGDEPKDTAEASNEPVEFLPPLGLS